MILNGFQLDLLEYYTRRLVLLETCRPHLHSSREVKIIMEILVFTIGIVKLAKEKEHPTLNSSLRDAATMDLVAHPCAEAHHVFWGKTPVDTRADARPNASS